MKLTNCRSNETMPGIGNSGRSWRSIFMILGHHAIVGEQSTLKVLGKHTANGSHRQSSFKCIMRGKANRYEMISEYLALIERWVTTLILIRRVTCGMEPQMGRPGGTLSRAAAVLLNAVMAPVRYSIQSLLKTRLRACILSAALSSSAKRRAAARIKQSVATDCFACTQPLLRAPRSQRCPVPTGHYRRTAPQKDIFLHPSVALPNRCTAPNRYHLQPTIAHPMGTCTQTVPLCNTVLRYQTVHCTQSLPSATSCCATKRCTAPNRYQSATSCCAPNGRLHPNGTSLQPGVALPNGALHPIATSLQPAVALPDGCSATVDALYEAPF
jgi:hypothetical protein